MSNGSLLVLVAIAVSEKSLEPELLASNTLAAPNLLTKKVALQCPLKKRLLKLSDREPLEQ